ncbi:MAG: sigma-E processing peptidase SpoIIGA [Lachnospiraceae bacterium]|nr:sigma-E processing peptidase SpoIIGA [Lachnospiraceae bacterium]
MRYEIYLDTLFLIQLVINYCVLMLTAAVMKLITSRLRIIIASMAGALGSCLMVMPIGINACVKFIVIFTVFGLIMTGIAFRVRGVRQYLCMLLAIVSATFLLGGVVQWMISLSNNSLPVPLWLLLLILVYGLLQYGLQQYRRQKSLFVPVTLSVWNENEEPVKVSVIALKDTGNRLREHETGKAVCILEEGVTSFELQNDYEVTYHSIGREEASMRAGIIPEMIIHTKEGDILSRNVMLALYPGKISKRGAYHMIMHPEYMKEE